MARPNPSAIAILIIIFILAFQPSNTIPYDQEQLITAATAREREQLAVLANSSYGDFAPWNNDTTSGWLNLTGLREGDRYKWHLLPQVQSRAKKLVEEITNGEGLGILEGQNGSLPLYHNVTGYLRGSWVRSGIGEDVGPQVPAINLSEIAPGVEYLNEDWGRNITGNGGDVWVRFEEMNNDLANIHTIGQEVDNDMRWLSARVTIKDETSFADGWAMTLYGVHYPESGSILLTTTSAKFAGVFSLPHFGVTQHFYDLAQKTLNITLKETIERQENNPLETDINPWSATNEEEAGLSAPLCEVVMYLQQHHLDGAAANGQSSGGDAVLVQLENLGNLEQELRFPSGTGSAMAPELKFSMLAFSPDCGFIIETPSPDDGTLPPGPMAAYLHGPKLEAHTASVKTFILILSLITISQLLLLIHQMKITTTPSARSRASFYTLAMMSLGTGFGAFTFLFAASAWRGLWLQCIVVAFFLFLEGNFFGIKFLMEVWMSQEPERVESERRREAQRAQAAAALNARIAAVAAAGSTSQQQSPIVTGNSANETVTGLPLPVTAPQPPRPPLLDPPTTTFGLGTPFAQALPTPTLTLPTTTTPTTTTTTQTPRPPTFGSFYTRYCLLLLAIIFLSIHAATTWPLSLRHLYTNTLALLYLSFWTPQIIRNIQRNCRRAFSWRFILGMSILRVLPIGYFWCYEGNVFFADTDVRVFGVFLGWMVLQVVVLAGQDFISPRWCVSERWSWVPRAWEYHPVLREDEEGGTMPIGFTPTSAEDEEAVSGLGEPSSPIERRRRTSSVVSGTELPLPELAREVSRKRGNGSGMRMFDCAICMQVIEAPIISSSDNRSDTTATNTSSAQPHPSRRLSTDTTLPSSSTAEAEGLLTGLSVSNLRDLNRGRRLLGTAFERLGGRLGRIGNGWLGNALRRERQRREYMVTPCRHIFHTQCLEGWMGYRLQCPICREVLPPL